MSCTAFTQSQGLVAAQKWLNCSAQGRPELDLAGDGSPCDFRGKTCVQNQGIGKLNRLTHGVKVAQCYRKTKVSETQRFQLLGKPSRLVSEIPQAREGKAGRLTYCRQAVPACSRRRLGAGG